MRGASLRATWLSVFILIIGACSGRPEQTPLPERVQLPLFGVASANMPHALWFTSSNFSSGGKLGRLDLLSGAINRSVLLLGRDTQIFPDGASGLFMLSRMDQDAITLLAGADAQAKAHYPLTRMVNPQAAVRDSKGRVWISAQDSDELLVLSPDLKEQLQRVDLGVLRAPTSLHADITQLAVLASGQIAVAAQRLDRGSATWKPNPKSALAVISTETLKIETSAEIDVTNVIQIAPRDGKLVVAGAGDLSQNGGALGKLASFDGPSLAPKTSAALSGKILAADLSEGEARAVMIVWYPSEMKSCIQVGETRLSCDGSAQNRGYVFNAVKRIGNVVFASYVATANSELWVIPVDQSQGVARVPMDMPLQSLSFGP